MTQLFRIPRCHSVGLALVLLVFPWSLARTETCSAKEPAKPRVLIRTGGPVSEVRELRFSADSNRLYAAGLDKVIHTWEIGWNQGDGKPPEVTLTRTMNWEIARGNRGGIYSMALDANRSLIAIGGNSARQQTGDIALLDERLAKVTTSLPTPDARVQASAKNQIGSEGHRFSVVSLDFSPGGKSLLSRDESGGMFVWRRNDREEFRAQQIETGADQNGQARFRPLGIFVDDDTIVFSIREANSNVKLVRRNLNSGKQVRFPENYPRRVAGLVRDPGNQFWASADDVGNVNLTSLIDSSKRSLLRASLPHVTGIQFGGSDLLAVMSCQSIDGEAGSIVVDLFNTSSRKRMDSVELSTQAPPSRAIAISPDGRYLAAFKEDRKELVVYPLRDSNDRPMSKPLSGGEPIIVRANSDPVVMLARSPDGKAIAFGGQSPNQRRVIEFETGEISLNGSKTKNWPRSDVDPLGWSVKRLDLPTTKIQVNDPNGNRGIITLDPTFQGFYSTHCFLFRPGNKDVPVGIAVGTENIDGIFVYEFVGGPSTDSVTQTRMVRWFRDHTDDVRALLPALGESVLFSGSLDRTVKGWFIGDLFDRDLNDGRVTDPASKRFSKQSFWGCDFRVENGAVIVGDVDSKGIAFSRSLRSGDRIIKVQGYDAANSAKIIGAEINQNSADQILQAIDSVSVLNQVMIFAKSRDSDPSVQADKQFIIRPAYEPFVTAFATRAGEWILWHPEGYFNASAAEGGGLLRWLINRGQNEPPRMLEGGFLSKDLERPDVILRLLSGESIGDAIKNQAVDGEKNLGQIIEGTPDVVIISPIAGESFPVGEESEVVATIDFGTADPSLFDVRGSIDGVRLSNPNRERIGGAQFRYVWKAKPTGLLNQVEVVATETKGALASSYASDLVFRRGRSINPTPFNLHILSLASEEYVGPLASQRDGFGKLEFPIDDVVAILDLLKEKQQSGHGKYNIVSVRELRDKEITPDSVRAEIAKLNRDVTNSREPLLVIYLSGHGTTIDGQFYYVTTSSKSAKKAELRRSCLPWSLLQKAGAPGCRVIYMIDTCHSGSAVDAKSSIRDPLRSGGIVIAAASGREAAQELSPLGHGCFTFSVLEALRGKADGVSTGSSDLGLPAELLSSKGTPNGTVDLEELVTFVRNYVPKLTGGQQRPSATPSRLTKTLAIPLVETE